jgi:hypothetical protein
MVRYAQIGSCGCITLDSLYILASAADLFGDIPKDSAVEASPGENNEIGRLVETLDGAE